MCCIWQCMAYTVPKRRPHIPVYAVYGNVWDIHSPRAGPTSLYVLYMAVWFGYTFPQSRPYIPVCAVDGSVWDIHSPRAGPTSLYVLYMAVYGIYIPPEQALHPCMGCIWQYMAYTVPQSRDHIPVSAVYGSVWHIQSPRAGPTSLYLLYMAVYGIYSPLEHAPHPCMCCIWQCMADRVPRSRPHIPVCAVYGSVWHIQSSRAGPTSLYVLHMAVYGIYSPPEQALHPCMCCIWQCMGYTFPQSRPYIPVFAVYGSVWHILSPQSRRYIPVYAVYGSVWQIEPPGAGPTSLYVLYMALYGIYSPPEQVPHPCICCIWQCMAYRVPRSRPHIPVCAVYGSVWHILSPQSRRYIPVCAAYGSVCHIQSPQSRCHIPVCAVYGSVWQIESPEQVPHPCICCIWQCMADRVPRSRRHIPVCAVYGIVWHIQSSRAGPTSLYVLYMAVYGIYSPPEQAPHPCICCIWQCMAYRVPRSRPHIPVCAAYGSVCHIQSPQSRCHIPVCAVYGSVWQIESPEQVPHPFMCCIWQCMADRVPRSRPHIPVCAAYGSVCHIQSPQSRRHIPVCAAYGSVCHIQSPQSRAHIPVCAAYGSVCHIQSPQSRCHIPVCAVYGTVWHIQSSRAGATSLYMLYMAVYGI